MVIVHDPGLGCRTKNEYSGTTEKTFAQIAELVDLYPNIKFVRIAGNALICGYNDQTRTKFKDLLVLILKKILKYLQELSSKRWDLQKNR